MPFDTDPNGLAPSLLLTDRPSVERDEEGHTDRLWYVLMTARVALGLATTTSVLVLLGSIPFAPSAGTGRTLWLQLLCAIYMLGAIAGRFFLRPPAGQRRFEAQALPVLAFDLVAFGALYHLSAGFLNLAPLFALPVLMASLLGRRVLAMGTATAVSVILLGSEVILSVAAREATPALLVQAVLTGMGYFFVAALANQLSSRLAREEVAAQRGRMAARQQAHVSALIIGFLPDGVLVCTSTGLVQAMNPVARELLGIDDSQPGLPLDLRLHSGWQALLDLARRTIDRRVDGDADLSIVTPAQETHPLHARARMASGSDGSGDALCVLFVQDLRSIQARNRTEKLAAMGRMSAAVAHEIRNPLAAISQANELLDEDVTDPTHRRLTAVVRQNAERLRRTVDEVLEMARVPGQLSTDSVVAVELDALLQTFVGDWMAQSPGRAVALRLGCGGQRVRFDEEQLRRVVINLLDNATRYASSVPDGIVVASGRQGDRPFIQVWSDGVELPPHVVRHMFEPFFSSESRSSGLGLFICQELCERQGALIDYQRCAAPGESRSRQGNAFTITTVGVAQSAA